MAKKKVDIIVNAKNRVNGVLKSISRRLKSFGRQVMSFKGLVAGAVGGALSVRGIQNALSLADKQITAERKLAGVLRATGNAAGFSAKQLKERAAELQTQTTFGDETIIELQSQLAAFGNIADEEFDRATKAALDLSTVFDQSLRQSTRQIGQALAEPEAGLTRLRRAGVTFTDEQEELIKTLAETGRQAEAQAIILTELEKRFGGVSQEVARGPIGAIKQAKNAIGDMIETIGQALAPFIAHVFGFLRGVAEQWIPKAAETVRSVGLFVLKAIQWIADGLQNFKELGVTAVASVEFAWNNFGRLVGLVVDKVLLFLERMSSKTVHLFTNTIPELLDFFMDNWQTIFRDVGTFTLTVMENMAKNVVRIIKNIPKLIKGDVSFGELLTPLTEGFEAELKELPELTRREVGAVEKALAKQVDESRKTLGRDFGEFVAARLEGVEGDTGALDDILRDFAESGRQAMKKSVRDGAEAVEKAGFGDGPTLTTGGEGSASESASRRGIEAIQIGRQFRGIADRFRAGVGSGGKSPEERTAEEVKKQTEQSKKQTKAITLLAEQMKRGGIKTLRTSLS